MIERILMNDQAAIAGLALLVAGCILLGYWIRGAENLSVRAGDVEPTEHGEMPL